jgi:Zn-dependent protease with chaperone function
MYVVVVALVALLLAVPQPPAEMRYVTQPAQVLAAVAAAVALPAGWAALVARRALKALEAEPAHPGSAQVTYGRGMLITQALLLILHGGIFVLTDWLLMCGRVPVLGTWFLAPTLLSLTPLLLSVALVWTAIYPADRALRQIGLELMLMRGRPVRPAWSLGRFLVYSFRHQVLFVLAPLMLILLARDIVARYTVPIQSFAMQMSRGMKHAAGARGLTPAAQYLPDLLLGCCTLLVALISPAILRHVWDTRPLASGPLRDRLSLLCKRLRMGCREILVWRSGGMLVNAAVMGVAAPLRYVLITDAMLEQMDDTHVEAVFGHEAGHVKRHHITFFLLFMFITGCLGTIANVLGDKLGEAVETLSFSSL